jgi:hypothetical protein
MLLSGCVYIHMRVCLLSSTHVDVLSCTPLSVVALQVSAQCVAGAGWQAWLVVGGGCCRQPAAAGAHQQRGPAPVAAALCGWAGVDSDGRGLEARAGDLREGHCMQACLHLAPRAPQAYSQLTARNRKHSTCHLSLTCWVAFQSSHKRAESIPCAHACVYTGRQGVV